MISFTKGQKSNGDEDKNRHRGLERSTNLCSLKRYGSVDSLSGWAPSEHAQTEYGLRKLSSDNGGRRSPPVYIDREKIDEAFRRNDLQPQRQQSKTKCRPQTTIKKNMTARESRTLIARLENEIKVLKNNSEESYRQHARIAYVKSIDSEFKILCRESQALKNECQRILQCGVGDGEIGNRVQTHKKTITSFFQRHVGKINSADSVWSLQHKTFFLEHLKMLFTLHVFRMDKWINLVIDTQ